MDKERQCLLSVIVPVYNGEKYLSVCLDSLVHQNVDSTQYEIICINDGSTDDSLSLLREYEQKYSNLRVIDKPNGGVSAARNLGLELAVGAYVWFVDVDDWVARDCFGFIFEQIETKAPGVIRVVMDYIIAQWRVEQCQCIALQQEKIEAKELPLEELRYTGIGTAILSRELIGSRKFHEGFHYGEDIFFVRDCYEQMQLEKGAHRAISLEGDIFYYYRQHEESAMHQSWGKNREKYKNALLMMARINRERMLDASKPQWYREMYQTRFYDRMYNYMTNWLPGGTENLDEHLKWLKAEGLYLCGGAPKDLRKEWLKAAGLAGKALAAYRYAAFRSKWIYRIYYKQMAKKYENCEGKNSK